MVGVRAIEKGSEDGSARSPWSWQVLAFVNPMALSDMASRSGKRKTLVEVADAAETDQMDSLLAHAGVVQGENEDLLALVTGEEVAASERAEVEVAFTGYKGRVHSIEVGVGASVDVGDCVLKYDTGSLTYLENAKVVGVVSQILVAVGDKLEPGAVTMKIVPR